MLDLEGSDRSAISNVGGNESQYDLESEAIVEWAEHEDNKM